MNAWKWLLILATLHMVIPANAVETSIDGFRGDVGLGWYSTRSIVEGVPDKFSILPYLDCTYGSVFARVDTFGLKTVPVGYGHVEIVARVNQDGFKTDQPALNGLSSRSNPLPVGVGTLQVTPVGGVFFNVFHDINKSGGNWVELIYGGRFESMGVLFYPLLGLDYQSAEYVGYYYDVSAQEALVSRFSSYIPSAAVNFLFGMIADFGLDEHWHINAYLRRKRLDDAIYQSPIVGQRYLDTAYLTLSYRY